MRCWRIVLPLVALLAVGGYFVAMNRSEPQGGLAQMAPPPPAPPPLRPTSIAATWKPFAPPGGRFSALFPHVPREETTRESTQMGLIERRNFMVDRGSVAYMVDFFDLPPAALQNFNVDVGFRGAIDALKSYLNGEIRSEKAITLDGHPGREYVIALPQGKGTWRGRSYLAPGRLYQVAVVWTGVGQMALSDEVDQFLDSFKLTDK